MTRSPLAGAVAVVLIYMIVRSVIYFALPANSLESWFVRDCWMTIPRFAAFACLYLLDRLAWRRFPFDVGFRAYKRPALYASVLLVMELVYLSGNAGREWPVSMKLGGLVTTPFVGLFEEYAFRGIVLEQLLMRYSVPVAVLSSSLLFTGYHVEAQPLDVWPQIFFFFDTPDNYSLTSYNTMMFLAGLGLLSAATYTNRHLTRAEP